MTRYAIKPTLPTHLSSSRYFFFGGKGGVGKTSAATATALLLLKFAKTNEKILLFSTDPAHSLSDSLGMPIGNRLVQVSAHRRAQLFAFEMDSKAALAEFRKKHGPVLAEIADRGTLLDKSDINELLNLSLPGLDEVMALFELSELDRESDYSHIVIDTAPSGHTTRLLRLPEVFSRMITALDRMADKHRFLVAQFARRRMVLDEVDLFLRDLNERIQTVRNLLYNSTESSFALVAIPEALSVNETKRYAEELRAEHVSVTDLIINRVEEEHDNCTFCRARVKAQKRWLNELSKHFRSLNIRRVPLRVNEIRGVEALKKFGEQIWIGNRVAHPNVAKSARAQKYQTREGFSFDERRIWIFGGKGGVGKTTSAAALALSLAKRDPNKRVLVFSTDPAHSLSDSFNETVGAMKSRVAGVRHLDAMEVDPGEWFENLKRRYRSWTNDLFDSLTTGSRLDIKFDREAMRELVELTPPGIDEIAALGVISDLVDHDKYDVIVLDTSPTGHLIRFLELPQMALDWIRTFIKLLLKYQSVVHAGKIGEELVALSKSIKRVLALLTDAQLCEFVGVAIPERMSLEETADLAGALNQLGVPMDRLLINGVIPESAAAKCNFCKTRRNWQNDVVAEFQRKFGKAMQLLVAPQQNRDIQGHDLLLRHFNNWRRIEKQ
jgi:arsenite-transporting ATPase